MAGGEEGGRRRLRVVFMGTPDFAVPTLAALAARHDVVCIYTQPPRPAGRGNKPRPSPVQLAAEAGGIAVRTPVSLKAPAEHEAFAQLGPDVAVVAAYGLILPRPVLEAPRLGCVNVHASLLPRWRGAAPIQRAIMAGDAETGVTIMAMEQGLDTGPMLLREALAIGPRTTAGDLHDRLAEVGARLLLAALEGLAAGTLAAIAQPEEGVTYARKIEDAEGRLDWTQPAESLDRLVRGLSPWPGAFCQFGDVRLKVLGAVPAAGQGGPGAVLDRQLTVACGQGALRLTRLQRPGKAPMDADAFLRGLPIPPGTVLA